MSFGANQSENRETSLSMTWKNEQRHNWVVERNDSNTLVLCTNQHPTNYQNPRYPCKYIYVQMCSFIMFFAFAKNKLSEASKETVNWRWSCKGPMKMHHKCRKCPKNSSQNFCIHTYLLTLFDYKLTKTSSGDVMHARGTYM